MGSQDKDGTKEERIRNCKSTPTRKKTKSKTKEYRCATDSRINKARIQNGDSEKSFPEKLRQNLTSPVSYSLIIFVFFLMLFFQGR